MIPMDVCPGMQGSSSSLLQRTEQEATNIGCILNLILIENTTALSARTYGLANALHLKWNFGKLSPAFHYETRHLRSSRRGRCW